MTFNFNSRETYIAFVRNWKAEYATNSEAIRDLKREIKELQKADEYAGDQQMRREYLRRAQRKLLVERQESKEEAQRQYLAAKEANQAKAAA